MRRNRIPMILLISSVVCWAAGLLEGTGNDAPKPPETNCPCLDDALNDFASRLHRFERRVTITHMFSASLTPSGCNPTLAENELKCKQVSGAMKQLQIDTDEKLGKMKIELDELQKKNAGLQTQVAELASYVDILAKKHAPATCQELRELGLAKSGRYAIDPDGVGIGEDPITVFCNMIPAIRGIWARGVTQICHNLENQTVEVKSCKEPGCRKTNVTYHGYSMNQIRSLINKSEHCSQEIQYNCLSALLTKVTDKSKIHMGSWRGVDGAENVYWDGTHQPDNHVCACDSAHNCTDDGYRCNCDSPLPVEWKRDAGVLTNKTALPVVQLSFGGVSGDTKQAANFTLGSLLCSSSAGLEDAADPDPIVRGWRDKVKEMMKHAWHSYETYAWGHDYLSPGTNAGAHYWSLSGSGGTIVDALDTLYLMGLKKEFERGVSWVEKGLPAKLKYKSGKTDLSAWQKFTGQIIGGLLSSHELSGDVRLLRAAVGAANHLLPVFETLTGLPKEWTNMSTYERASTKLWSDVLHPAFSASVAHPEFSRLSQLTSDSKYVDQVMKAREVVRGWYRANSLDARQVDAKDVLMNYLWTRPSDHFHFYDHLLKSWLVSGGQDQEARDIFVESINALTKRALKMSKSGMLYVPVLAYSSDPSRATLVKEMDLRACFWGGLYALWSQHELEPRRGQHQQPGAPLPPSLHDALVPARGVGNVTTDSRSMMDIGQRLTATCRLAYNRTKTQLAPWRFPFEGDGSQDAVTRAIRSHTLQHEAVESYFVLWRLTGDKKYREWGWDVVQAIDKYCRRDAGYSPIEDVNQVPVYFWDEQPSYFLGATLKYLYLLFSDKDLLPLDQWVFNAWGHPLPVWKGEASSA